MSRSISLQESTEMRCQRHVSMKKLLFCFSYSKLLGIYLWILNPQQDNLCCVNVADLFWIFHIEFNGDYKICNKTQLLRILLHITYVFKGRSASTQKRKKGHVYETAAAKGYMGRDVIIGGWLLSKPLPYMLCEEWSRWILQ